MADEKTKEVPENVKETEGGNEGQQENPTLKSRSDDEKVMDGDKDPAVPQRTQMAEQQVKDVEEKGSQKVATGKVVHPDEQTSPARNDPYHSAAPDVLLDPTASGLDRDQSLGFTDRTATEDLANQSQVDHVPDAPHREPSSYTPSGARPGQQNPVNPQGSPGADPFETTVGARPLEHQVVVSDGRDGDYTKLVTPGEKNPSQRPYEIDHQPTDNNY